MNALPHSRKWLRWQSEANLSLQGIPCYAGNLQGISAKMASRDRIGTPQITAIPHLFEQIPHATEQGIFVTDQGIISSEQGTGGKGSGIRNL
jgi:hypothetical protein